MKNLGKIGESKVHKELKKKFKKKHILHNITLKLPGKNTSQIDHVLITDHRVFVIETKHYSGIIKEFPGKYWYQDSNGGKRYPLYNPIFQNDSHCNNISFILGIPKELIVNIVVFSGDAKLKTKSKNVIKLKRLLKYIKKKNTFKLGFIDKKGVRKIIKENSMKKSKKTDKKHIKNVRRLITR